MAVDSKDRDSFGLADDDMVVVVDDSDDEVQVDVLKNGKGGRL